MVVSTEAIDEMEIFFMARQLPAVFTLNAAAKINDLPGFVQRTLENVKNPQVSDRVNGPRWDDLLTIRRLLEKNKERLVIH